MPKLVVFGDSWPAGGELKDRTDAFPYLLADQLGLELQQIATDGSSQPYDVHRFIKWLEHPLTDPKDSLVLFCFTGKDRSWFFKNGLIRNIHPSINDPEITAYYRHLYSPELADAESEKGMLLLQTLSTTFNVTIRMIMNWDSIPASSLIDKNIIYPLSLAGTLGGHVTSETGLTHFFNNSEYIKPNLSHPNPKGHKHIADQLALWLKPTADCLLSR
jgi:hypothetical protein